MERKIRKKFHAKENKKYLGILWLMDIYVRLFSYILKATATPERLSCSIAFVGGVEGGIVWVEFAWTVLSSRYIFIAPSRLGQRHRSKRVASLTATLQHGCQRSLLSWVSLEIGCFQRWRTQLDYRHGKVPFKKFISKTKLFF
ncbi:uncharacterized protein LOC112494651 [Cephus cinctus]|uniref:Uncharacterized protein LOC112494651 n=1 Tax=Cephus cinctus TaxID=211228 RepID=A0AAJ7RLX3_CEPCN|nr:uncharacterized protein LOC112494651 [Cephus cinctus]